MYGYEPDSFLEMEYEDNNGNLEFADFGDFWDEQDFGDEEDFATETDYWDAYDEVDDLDHFERFLHVPEDEYQDVDF